VNRLGLQSIGSAANGMLPLRSLAAAARKWDLRMAVPSDGVSMPSIEKSLLYVPVCACSDAGKDERAGTAQYLAVGLHYSERLPGNGA
jgi:hypothetical protein